jgi:gluconolactonase
VLNQRGEIYFSDPEHKQVWFIDAKGSKRVVHEGIGFPNGVHFSPDQSLLLVDDSAGKWVWSFQIEPDGSLVNGQPFYRLETPDESSSSGADGMAVDTEGYLYVTTRIGVQVCDQPGRVTAIINKPQSGPIERRVHGTRSADPLRDRWGQSISAAGAPAGYAAVGTPQTASAGAGSTVSGQE